jgi:hypothetical protein
MHNHHYIDMLLPKMVKSAFPAKFRLPECRRCGIAGCMGVKKSVPKFPRNDGRAIAFHLM